MHEVTLKPRACMPHVDDNGVAYSPTGAAAVCARKPTAWMRVAVVIGRASPYGRVAEGTGGRAAA